MAQWFGRSWGAPVCDPEHHAPTPVGEDCVNCDHPIGPFDSGMILPYIGGPTETVAFHRECFLAEVLGPYRDLRSEVPSDAEIAYTYMTCPYYWGMGSCRNHCYSEPECHTMGPFGEPPPYPLNEQYLRLIATLRERNEPGP